MTEKHHITCVVQAGGLPIGVLLAVIGGMVLLWGNGPGPAARAEAAGTTAGERGRQAGQRADPCASVTDASTNSCVETCPPALADVQDFIDTIDQAGLLWLMERASTESQPPDGTRSPSPAPDRLLAAPAAYRGRLLEYRMFLHPAVWSVQIDRPTSPTRQLYYVVGQIPFASNLRMPAIILLLGRPEGRLVDQMTVRGYFYMVLRAPTRREPGQSGADRLDYLVFVAHNLPAGTERPGGPEAARQMRLAWFSGAGVSVLFLVWLVLRWRVRPRPAATRAQKAPRGGTGYDGAQGSENEHS